MARKKHSNNRHLMCGNVLKRNFAKDGAPYLMLLSMYEVSCILSIRSKACFAFKFGAKKSVLLICISTPEMHTRHRVSIYFRRNAGNSPEVFLRENFISSSSQMRN